MRRSPALALLLLAAAVPAPAQAADAGVFTRVKAATVKTDADGPRRFAAFALDRADVARSLRRPAARRDFALPGPDGRPVRFTLREVPVMEAGLQRRHPEIRTYAGRAVGDPATTVRLSVTPLGLHASVRGPASAWYLEPPRAGADDRVVAFTRTALPPGPALRLREPLGEHSDARAAAAEADAAAGEPVTLRTFRLALISNPAYAQSSGAAAGLDPASSTFEQDLRSRTTAAKAILMARVNQLYESDFAVRLLLVDATDRLNLNSSAEATGAGGPCGPTACYTTAQLSSCSSGLLTRNQAVAGLLVGARDYDIGHIVLGAGGGGIAGLGVVGKERKASGCTGLAKPVGDVFAVDYVAHEMGHQFGGDHTFNGNQGSCAATNRNLTGTAAVEPGSGTTVQAYAGICAADNLQSNSDPVFSQFSIAQMGAYIRSAPQGLSSVQQVVLRDRGTGFRLAYGDARTATLAPGAAAGAVQTALAEVLPAGASATVAGTADGYAVTFGGDLAAVEPALLGLEVDGGSGFVGETRAGGPTTQGGTTAATTNRAPLVTAPAAFTIPAQTPFALTAQGTDADGEPLTFLWEQADGSVPALGTSLLEPIRAVGPLFRVFGEAAVFDASQYAPAGQNLPGTDPSRSFPDLAQVASGDTNALTGVCPAPASVDCSSELLPTLAWRGTTGTGVMRFRATARDNHPGAGGTGFADTAVTVSPAARPFRVLRTGLPVDGAGTLTAVWDTGRTEVVLGTAQVRITLSTDGGRTFPVVLAETTANDGTESLRLPEGLETTQGRLRIEAVGNVFFDVSREDLTIG